MAKKPKRKTDAKAFKTLAKKAPKIIDTKTLGTLELTTVQSECVEYSVDCELDGRATELVLYSKENTTEMDATIQWASNLSATSRRSNRD